MGTVIDNDVWSERWGVAPERAESVRSVLQRELFHAWNSPRTVPQTGRIRLFPDHLQRPGQTGMYLLRAMGTDLTPLPKDLQHLITATSCQHRMELAPQTDEIPALYYYDGRAMYLGCCQGLGIAGGHVRHVWGEEIRPDERGRARVEFWARPGWSHVGLLPVKQEDSKGWSWPLRGECWADLAEIRFARSMGWEVHVREKLTWPEARPLDLWAERLSRLYLGAHQAGDAERAGCYRAIALHTIGRLHNLGYRDERTIVAPDDERVTFENVERIGPEGVQIKERVAVEKPAEECHPEWSSAIWSKARLRVNKRLMELPRETIVAVRGDAIYMTADPGWEDSGACGVLRKKSSHAGPLAAPTSWAELRGSLGG